MTNDQKLAVITQVLTGGSPGMGGFPSASAVNEAYSTIATPTTMMGQIHGIAAPMLGRALGMNNVQLAPFANDSQGVGEAWYAQHRNNAQWEMMQQTLQRGASKGMAADFTNIASGMGIPKPMGMSNSAFGSYMRNGANSAIGGAVIMQAMNNPAMSDIMGGNPAALMQSMFANRHSYAQPTGMINEPLNATQQTNFTRIASDVSNHMLERMRGNGSGGIGMVQNIGYTRGFRDEQIGQLTNRMAQSGAFQSETASLAMMDGSAAKDGKRWTDTIKAIGDKAGGQIKAFEALGDLLGERGDMNKLMETMSQLTQGNWAKMDPGKLTESIRGIQGMAVGLNRSKEEMLGAVMNIQAALGANSGITPGMRTGGMTGGGYTSPLAAMSMTTDIYKMAEMSGDKSPENINRIMKQQLALDAIGQNSTAGRAVQGLAFAHSAGLIDQGKFNELSGLLSSGTGSVRTDATKQVAAIIGGGSEERGRAMLRDTQTMAYMRENTSAFVADQANVAMRVGRANEMDQAVQSIGDRNMSRALKGFNSSVGRRYGVNPDVLAAEQKKSVLSYLRGANETAGAEVAESVYDRAIAAGKSPREAMAMMHSRLKAMKGSFVPGMGEEVDNIILRKQNAMEADAALKTGLDSGHANAVLQGISAVKGDRGLGDDAKAEMRRIRELGTTDPVAAAKAADALLASGNFSAAERNVISRGVAKGDAAARAGVGGIATTREMQERISRGRLGRAVGGGLQQLDVAAILKVSADLTAGLSGVSAGFESGEGVNALAEFQQKVAGDANMQIALGETGMARIAGLKTKEDVAKELLFQRGVNVSTDQATMGAGGIKGVPLEMLKATGQGKLHLADRAETLSRNAEVAGAMQAVADGDPAARKSITQAGLSVLTGNMSMPDAFGITGDTARGAWGKGKKAASIKEGAGGSTAGSMKMAGTLTLIEPGRASRVMSLDASGRGG